MENWWEKVINAHKILILGGTSEAFEIAINLKQQFPEIDTITSLAGRTKNPRTPPGQFISGGFGGELGLQRFLKNEKIRLVIDATHPFAQKISNSSYKACKKCNIPRIMLVRPEWNLNKYRNFIEVENIKAASNIIAKTSTRVFITTGTKGLNHFENMINIWFLIRLIQAPLHPLKIKNHKIILCPPPFNIKTERTLLKNYRIDCLLSKNSGSTATKAKIIAASELDIPIIFIRQPPRPVSPQFDNITKCLELVKKFLN